MLPEATDEAVHLLPTNPAIPDLTLRPQVLGNLLPGALWEVTVGGGVRVHMCGCMVCLSDVPASKKQTDT